jgi:nicotinamidase-related amidase
MGIRAILWAMVACVILSVPAAPGTGEERQPIELKPALLVIDVQNVWLPSMSQTDRDSALQAINEVIGLFREFDQPIIRVYHTDPKRGPEPGTEPFEFAGPIAVTDDDLKVIKNHPSAFTSTDLEQTLRNMDRNIVFLCGLSATGCVLATYFGADDRGFMAFMVESALLSSNSSYTKVIEDICSSLSVEKIRKILEDPFL